MSKKGFVINDKGFGLEGLGWKQGQGDCNFQKELRDSCPKKYSSGKQKDCVDTVTAHCCKHVLNGTAAEREAFQEKTEQDKLPDKFHVYPENNWNWWSIPPEVREAQALEQKTVENYRNLSYKVAQTTELVAVTAHNNQIRFVCSGEGEKASGFTDYFQYSVEKGDYYDSEDDSGYAHYDIVSMFLQDLRVTEFSLMDLLYCKFCAGEQKIDQVKICPTLSVSETWDAPPQDRFEYDKDYIEIQYLLKYINLLAEKTNCRQLVPFGMYWHYTQYVAEKISYVDSVLSKITPTLSAENPIPQILNHTSRSQSIKELKKVLRYNEQFFRNVIFRQYLSWICKINANELLHNVEKYRIDLYKIVETNELKTVAWQMFATSFFFYRSMTRLKDMVSQKTEMNDLMSEGAPYSLADFSAFQLWSDMFTAHACIKLLQKYRRQYKDLYEKEEAPSYSPWSSSEDARLNTAKKDCNEIIHNILSAFSIPAMDRWSKRFYAAFKWDALV